MNLNSTNSQKRTLFNFFSLSLLQVGNYVLPMITLPIISRIIGPEKYGVVNYAYAFVGYFVLFINAGFDFYGARKILEFRNDKGRLNRLFSSITIAKSYLLLLSALFFVAGIFLIPQLRGEKLVSLFTFLLCIGWVVNPSWLYNGMQESRNYAFFSFVTKLIFSIAIIIVIQHRGDYIYQPMIMGFSHVLFSSISLSYATRKYGIKFKYLGWQSLKQTFKENKHLALIWWLSNQASSTNIIIAGLFLSTLDLGIYSAALRMIIIIQIIISMPLNTVLFPYIGEAFVSGYEDGINRVNKSLPYVGLIVIFMALGAFLFAKPVILIFYGYQFTAAINLLRISSFVLLFSTLNSTFGQQILLHLKLDITYLKFIGGGFLLNIIFLVAFTKMNGSTGAAIAWPLAEMLIFIAYLVYFKVKQIKAIQFQYFTPKQLVYNISNLFKLNIMFYFVKKPWWLKMLYGDCVWEIEGEEKILYLTFDDGPHPLQSHFILDQLKKYNATATFFCLGKNVADYYREYQRIIDEGHVIGNHTHTHLDGWKTRQDIYIRDVEQAKGVIESSLFRPPYGHISRSGIKKLAKNLNLKTIMWSVMSGDFDSQTSEEKCYKNVIRNSKEGSIIVFHDNSSASKNLRYALPRVLEYFSNRGYQFRSIT